MQSSGSPEELDWNVEPTRGWGPIKLGMTQKEVVRILDAEGIAYEIEPEEPLYLPAYDVGATFHFLVQKGKEVLVHINLSVVATVHGESILQESLLNGLTALGVTEYSDTLWSLESIDELDEKRSLPAAVPDTPTDRYLFNKGVLWIRSQGIGMSFLSGGRVYELAIRDPRLVPSQGFGPLLAEHLEAILRLEEEEAERDAKERQGSGRKGSLVAMLGVSLLLIGYFAHLVWSVPQFKQKMLAAPSIEGHVILREPENFPEKFTIEYTANDVVRQVVLARRELVNDLRKDGTIELKCLPESPENAMSLTQVYAYDLGNYVGHFAVLSFLYTIILSWLFREG